MKKQFNKFLMVAMMIGFFVGMGQGKANALFTQCPTVGYDTGCAVLLTIGAGGSMTVTYDGTQGPYDGIEDTLVGVVNNSGGSISGLNLSGVGTYGIGLFDFDGDGLCYYVSCSTWAHPTGYEGPITSFSGITTASTYHDTGTVNFLGGLANGTSTYFSLEDNLSCGTTGVNCGTITGGATGGGVPEPASLLLLGSGLIGLGLFGRKKLQTHLN